MPYTLTTPRRVVFPGGETPLADLALVVIVVTLHLVFGWIVA